MRPVALFARCFAFTTLIGVLPAASQDQANGERIAKTWCGACHRVTTDGPIAGSDAIPPFSSIAQSSSTTESSLEAFLSTSHAGMSDYNLTRQEIADVSAYILSLRK